MVSGLDPNHAEKKAVLRRLAKRLLTVGCVVTPVGFLMFHADVKYGLVADYVYRFAPRQCVLEE